MRTGLSFDHDALSRHNLVLSPGGTCAAEMRASYCGHFQSDWQTDGKTCRWRVWNPRGRDNKLKLMFGEGRESFVFELHLIDRDGLVLWMYLCDPDSDEYVELTRGVR